MKIPYEFDAATLEKKNFWCITQVRLWQKWFLWSLKPVIALYIIMIEEK